MPLHILFMIMHRCVEIPTFDNLQGHFNNSNWARSPVSEFFIGLTALYVRTFSRSWDFFLDSFLSFVFVV